MKTGLRAFFVGLLVLASLPVLASELTLAPSLAACLTPAFAERGAPEYPDGQWAQGMPGRVLVELAFASPDQRPEVKILESAGGPQFVESVRRHVRGWRLPCMVAADSPARVQFDFVFNPVERKGVASEATDPDQAEKERQLACVANRQSPRPEFSMHGRGDGVQGRILLEMLYTNADGPPVITLHARPSTREFHEPLVKWAQQFRMPCYAGRPVHTNLLMIFLDGVGQRFGFKNVRLLEFLGSIRGIEEMRIDFDFNTMGCPFELRLQYLQPSRANWVVQVNEPLSARQPFVDWLAAAELKLSERQQDAVFGDTLVLTVPCGKFDLEPKVVSPAPR